MTCYFFEGGGLGGKNASGELRQSKANSRDLDDIEESKAKAYGHFALSRYHATNLTRRQWKDTSTLGDILGASDDSAAGFFVEVNIIHPSSQHDPHKDLSLAPQKLSIHKSWLSPYPQSFNVKIASDGREKLVETLLDKDRYVCHYPKPKFYVKHGLKFQNYHRVVLLRRSERLGDYFLDNTATS